MSEPRAAELMTAEEFARLPDNGRRRELIAGEVVTVAPTFYRHGYCCLRIMKALASWVDDHGLGTCADTDVGVLVSRDPDTVVGPDGAFYTRERLPDPNVDEWLETPPDLVLEVVSEHDRRGEVLAKVGQWVDAGVQVVWVAWPKLGRITVFGPGDEHTILSRGDTLTCESLLPGFTLPLDEVFPT